MVNYEQLVRDILEEYKNELDKAACDRCEDCGSIMMCSFHSVLSLLQRHTFTTNEIQRREFRT